MFLIDYLLSEYRKRMYATAKQTFLLSIVIGCLFFFAAMWPSINYEATATFQHAKYDIRMNGPFSSSDVKNILASFERNLSDYFLVNSGAAAKLKANNRSHNGAAVTLYDKEDFGKLSLSFFTDALILSGSMKDPDSIGIDYMTAKNMGIRIGDKIDIEQVYSNLKGEIKEFTLSGFVTAIYAPTNEVKGIIAPHSAQSKKLLSSTGVDYTDIFIKTLNGDQVIPKGIIDMPESKNWLLEPLPAAYANGKARMEQTLNRNIRNATVMISLAIYLVYIMREQFLRIDRRRKNIAILFSMGCSRLRLYKLFFIEQLFVNLVTVTTGFFLGTYILEVIYGVFIPMETTYFLVGFFFTVNLVVLLASMAQISYLLNRFDVAKLLTSE